MALDERVRHEFHAQLEEVLGPEEADTLMSYLPPVGWADVATKSDVAALKSDLDEVEERFRLELQATKHELLATFQQELHSEIHSAVRSLTLVMSSMFIAIAGIAFAAARLT